MRLEVGRRGAALAFPMKDPGGSVTGIRYRSRSGRKWSEKGSHEGLFLPNGLTGDGPLLLPEGPTDTAALLDLGFDAIGRPSCTSGIKLAARIACGRQVVVVGDNDDHGAGHRGADSLASTLVAFAPTVKTIFPPTELKDMRDWLRAGANRDDLLGLIAKAKARSLRFAQARERAPGNGRCPPMTST